MKIKKNKIAILLWLAGIYITPYLLRDKFFPGRIYPFNILSWIGIIIFFANNYLKYGKLSLRRISHIGLFICVIVTIALVAFLLMGERNDLSIPGFIKIFIAVIAPIIVLGFTFDNYEGFDRIYSRALNIVNIAAYFILACGLIDIASSFVITKFFVNTYDIDSLYSMVNQGRLVSYFGHSLLSAEILIIYYLLNYLKWNCISKKHNIAIPTIVSLFSIALTGSKTGIILLFLMILITYFNFRMMKYVPVTVFVGFMLYHFGFFDLVIERFLYGLSSSDLSTGRNTKIVELLTSGSLQFYLFHGNSGIIAGNALIAATEYPIIRWAYLFGICFAVLISAVVFLWPIIRFFNQKNYRVFLMILVIVIDVNSYSTLPSTMDGMLIYCTTLFLAYNAVRYSREVEFHS